MLVFSTVWILLDIQKKQKKTLVGLLANKVGGLKHTTCTMPLTAIHSLFFDLALEWEHVHVIHNNNVHENASKFLKFKLIYDNHIYGTQWCFNTYSVQWSDQSNFSISIISILFVAMYQFFVLGKFNILLLAIWSYILFLTTVILQ